MNDPYASDASRLQSAIARWLTDHGHSDPATGAVEIVHIVRGHGWRIVEALRPPSDQPSARPVTRPTARPEVAEALARCAAASERFHSTSPKPERSS
ncbi:hypothetical protein [Nonomuraea angiospora]|uniref:hypothetical protein n=1 Tax=Nonomuraea angiospora TaxID=46172 RepID=UPI00299FF1FF|nr:hypothetical protein [Nonomuraea angiospora]MDX3109697.1 hypothetical protein [Nonomuraea angiospora]